MRRALVALAATTCVLLGSAGLASCGKDSAEPKNCRRVTGSAVTLVALNVAWDTSCLDLKAGTARFTIDNKDDVQHNLRVSGNGVNQHTKLQAGPVVEHLTVDLTAGTYTFVCDIHANMEGKLYVN